MKIGVIGSGDVARTLAGGFLGHGYEELIGTRNPAKLMDWTARNPRARIGTFAEAANFAEVIVLAVKGAASAEALRSAGATDLAGKPVIDATNPIADSPPHNGVLKFFTTLDESLMERLQHEFPAAHFVKAFNSVGNACMVNPSFVGGKPTMFICGNDEAAKRTVEAVLDRFGWATEDMGQIEAARAIEPLCMLWCIPGFVRNDWTHAFKLTGRIPRCDTGTGTRSAGPAGQAAAAIPALSDGQPERARGIRVGTNDCSAGRARCRLITARIRPRRCP